MNRLRNDQLGATAMFLTVLILSAVTTITFAGSQIILANLRVSRERYDSTRAYYAAESGAERILWALRKDSLDPSGCVSPSNFCFDMTSNEIDPSGFICAQDSCMADSGGLADNDFPIPYGPEGDARGEITYFYDGLSTTTLASIGSFRNVGRQIQLKY